MRYEFVKAEKAIYPVSVLCHVLRVSRSGFYAWVQRGESKRSRENRSLLKEIQAAHRVSRSNYGSPRITPRATGRGDSGGRETSGPNHAAEWNRRQGAKALPCHHPGGGQSTR